MVKEDQKLYVQVFGKDYAGRVKSDEDLKTTSSKRVPGINLNEGDKIEFLKEFAIVEETTTIGGRSVTFDAFVVKLNGTPVRFTVGMLQNAGFDGIVGETAEEVATKIAERAAGTDVNNGKVAHKGTAVDAWQNAGTQAKAVKALSGRTATVHVCGYMAGTFDSTPRKQYEINLD